MFVFLQHGLVSVSPKDWPKKLLEVDSLVLFESLAEFLEEEHQVLLQGAIMTLEETTVYMIGTEVIAEANTDAKYKLLAESSTAEAFLYYRVPRNLRFDLSTEWALRMAEFAILYRTDSPFHSLSFINVPQEFHGNIIINGKLRASKLTITLTHNVCEELKIWYEKIESVKDLIIHNECENAVTTLGYEMPQSIEGVHMYSKEMDPQIMATLISLIPFSKWPEIKRIGMNASMLITWIHLLRNYCINLEEIVMECPHEAEHWGMWQILDEWNIAFILNKRESEGRDTEQSLLLIPNVVILGHSIEYGQVSFLVKSGNHIYDANSVNHYKLLFRKKVSRVSMFTIIRYDIATI